MKKPISFFASTTSGTEVLKVSEVESVVAPVISKSVYLPALSTVHVHVSGTASVDIRTNAFDDAAKAVILTTLTASSVYVVPSAAIISLNVTAVTGTVSARAIANQELDD